MKTNYEKKCKKRLPKGPSILSPSFFMKKIVNTVNSLQKKWRTTGLWRIRTAVFAVSLFVLSTPAFADDPVTNASTWLSVLVFGALGVTMCSIVLAADFYMAKLGKISWDKFMHDALCICGFIGAPSLVALLAAVAIKH